MIVADEPDPHAPDDWRIHAYFAEQPTTQELVLLRRLAADGEPEVEHLEDTTDWVTMSQSGSARSAPAASSSTRRCIMPTGRTGAVSFEIDAGLAFGTGQHATTAGCLAALDRLETRRQALRQHRRHRHRHRPARLRGAGAVADAKAIATDIDQIAIDVSDDNARINGVRLGHGAGELLLAVADGMDHPLIAARAPSTS